jgi:hypothetical protein
MMFAPGQQFEAPPAQDLQCRLHHRICVAVEPVFAMIRNTEKRHPQHTVVAYSDNARSWKVPKSSGFMQKAVSWRKVRAQAAIKPIAPWTRCLCADEGGNP